MPTGLAGEGDFAFEKELLKEAIYFKLAGSINSSNTPSIRSELIEAAKDNNLFIDMSKVTMLTSTGVGTLFEITDLMSKSDKKLILVAPSERVKQVIDLTGFAELFFIVQNVDAAIEALNRD